MGTTLPKLALFALCVYTAAPHAFGSPPSAATIRTVSVLGAGQTVEVEITATQPITPTTQEVKNPERLVWDFPDALPR